MPLAVPSTQRDQALAQERARLLGDLHDGLGLHLNTALRQARQPGVQPAALVDTLQDCLDDLRLAIDSLDEQERDPLSLLGSLRYRMVPRFAALGLQLAWQVDPDIEQGPPLEAGAALHLLRAGEHLVAVTPGLAQRIAPRTGTSAGTAGDGRAP